MKTIYVIKDKIVECHNGVLGEYIDSYGKNTSLLENAKIYKTQSEAEDVIKENNWSNWAYVSEEEIN